MMLKQKNWMRVCWYGAGVLFLFTALMCKTTDFSGNGGAEGPGGSSPGGPNSPSANPNNPGSLPGTPGGPGGAPGSTPGGTPGATPGTTPGTTPGGTPGTTPGGTPGTTPGTPPGGDPQVDFSKPIYCAGGPLNAVYPYNSMDEAVACGTSVMKASAVNTNAANCAATASVGPCAVKNIADQNMRLSTRGYRCACLYTKLANFPDINWQGTPQRMCKRLGKC